MDYSKWVSENRLRLLVCILAVLVLFAAMPLAGITEFKLTGWLIPDIASSNFWDTDLNSGDILEPDYGWISLSWLFLLILTAFGSLAFMLSSILGEKVRVFAKNFLFGIAKSAIILVILSTAFVGVNEAPADAVVGVGLFQIKHAITFAETVRNTIIYEFLTMTTITAILSTIGNITPYFRPAGMIGISFSLAPAFRPIFDSLGIMLSSLAVAVGAWYVQLWFLIFVQTRLMAIFMPIGLFLRAVGIDRVGNVLMAIAIGFYFVFPFVLNINAIALENYLESHFAGQRSLSEEFGKRGNVVRLTQSNEVFEDYKECVDYRERFGKGLGCYFKLSSLGALTYLKQAIKNFGWASFGVFGLFTFVSGSLPASFVFTFLAGFLISLLATTLFYVIVVSVLMPLFNIFITLTVIKEIAKYLGTELDLTALEKIF